MRKRRADSILHNLPEATQRAVYALETEEALTLEDIRSRLMMPEAEGGFGLGSISVSTIAEFLRHMRTAAFRDRIRAANTTAAEVASEATKTAEHVDDAILAGLREWILDTLLRGELDAKSAKTLVGLVLKGRQQDLDARKVSILEKKASAFDDAAKTAADDTLTPEERLAKIREGLQV